MAKSDREKASDLEATWDRLAGTSPVRPPSLKDNPYKAKVIETEANPEDTNLMTSFLLLANAGFDQPVGTMMAKEAEALIPRTLAKLHVARERARSSNNQVAMETKERIRGMTLMAYAWGFTMSRTGTLIVRDNNILDNLMRFADSSPDTIERRNLCTPAQNKLENTLGMLLQSIKSAETKHNKSLTLFYNGALMMLYALSFSHYGPLTEEAI